MARCPSAILRTRLASAENEAMRILVAAAFSLSPRVEISAPGACTIDLQGTDRQRTETSMRLRTSELLRMGLPTKAGVGDTPLIAWYAAQCAEPLLIVGDKKDFLSRLPLTFAEPTPLQQEILRDWGVQTLGQLTSLPKAEVGKRLGVDGVALWERAAGEATRVLRTTIPARTFVSRWDYEPPIENLEPLLFKLRRYAEILAFELRAAGFVAESLALTFELENETDYQREFRLAEPNTDIESWLKVLHAHFESLRLEARVVEVTMIASPTRPVVRQDGLFDTGLRDPHSFWENIARVEAVLGPGRIGTPRRADVWKPDTFIIERPAESISPSAPTPVHGPRGGVLRRYRPPFRALVEMTNGKPVAVQSVIGGGVVALAGPWRVGGDWWQPRSWQVETWWAEFAAGGVYQLARTPDGWFIEGVVD